MVQTLKTVTNGTLRVVPSDFVSDTLQPLSEVLHIGADMALTVLARPLYTQRATTMLTWAM